MNTNTSICPLMPFSATKYFKIPVYSIVLVAGLPLNILALRALLYQLKKSMVLFVYIINLMVAHLLQILTLPLGIYYSLNDHFWGLGKVVCVVVSMAFRTNFYAKNSFLCLIAMERYIGLVYPFKFHGVQTIPSAVKISIMVWLLVMILCATGVWLQMDNSEQERLCLDSFTLNPSYAKFRVNIMGLSFIGPLLLMAFFHISVLFKLRKVISLEKRVKKQICGFLSLIIIAFFLLFIPHQTISYYRYLLECTVKSDKVCDLLRNIFLYKHVALCISLLDNILDPLFYNLLLKDSQTDFKNLLSCIVHRQGIQSETEAPPPHLSIQQMPEHLNI